MYDLYAWLRAHPLLVDSLLALLLFGGSANGWGGAGGPVAVAVAVAVVAALAGTVMFRRRYPVAAFGVAAVIGLAQVVLGESPAGGTPPVRALQPSGAAELAIPILLYTLAAYRPRRVSVSALALCLLGAAVAVSRWAPLHESHRGPGVSAPLGLIGGGGLAGILLAAWVLGDSMAYRRAYYVALEDRAARLEAERDAQARIAAAAERVRELQERRAHAVDESAARLRRIERDLHDGAQVRLAALALALGEIKENLASAGHDGSDGGHTLSLVTAAHSGAKEALTELRDLARGIHPPVLDRGLRPALSTLAEASAVPVVLNVTISARPSPAIEAIAYFCAAELLANVTKHSGASRATIGVTDCDGRLIMTVTDNGAGRARPVPGGGLAGLAERVQTVDGKLGIDSPAGGPTIVTVELPGHA